MRAARKLLRVRDSWAKASRKAFPHTDNLPRIDPRRPGQFVAKSSPVGPRQIPRVGQRWALSLGQVDRRHFRRPATVWARRL